MCPLLPRACARARARSRQLPGPGALHRSRANRLGPLTMSLAPSGVPVKLHVPAPCEASWFSRAPAPQNPCASARRPCAARRPLLSMRASQWPRQRLGPRPPKRQRSQFPLPVTHIPPFATPNAGKYKKGWPPHRAASGTGPTPAGKGRCE